MQKLSMDELNRKTVAQFKDAEKIPIVVVLENIRSAYNVGSVFRTADAFLLQAVYLCGYTAFPPHKEIKKTALGAEETVHWQHFTAASEGLSSLRREGYTILSVEQAIGSTPLQQLAQQNEKLAVVFGNEVTGVTQETLEASDGCIEIPQLGMKHSLNISVAAGIVLWELVRQKISV